MANPTEERRRYLARLRQRASIAPKQPTLSAAEAGTLREGERKMINREYESAIIASRASSAKYGEAQVAYRSRLIGDAEFLAARAEFISSQKEFDVAFAREEALSARTP